MCSTKCPCLFVQISSIDSQKRNSVRHKLVSLTLKRKSKITEEVRNKPETSLKVNAGMCCELYLEYFHSFTITIRQPIPSSTEAIVSLSSTKTVILPLRTQELLVSHFLDRSVCVFVCLWCFNILVARNNPLKHQSSPVPSFHTCYVKVLSYNKGSLSRLIYKN